MKLKIYLVALLIVSLTVKAQAQTTDEEAEAMANLLGVQKAYSHMTPALADSLALQYFANREENEKIFQSYYGKIKKAVNPIVAFEFYQAEIYLLTQLRAQIMQQIPTYGEVQRSIKKN